MIGILIKCLLLAALAGFVFVACKSNSGEVKSFDEDAPHVVSVIPGDGTTDVPVNTSITVSFDEAMNSSTISFNSEETDCSGSVQLSEDGFINCVPLSSESLSFGPDQLVFSISPQFPLEGFTNYKIKISTAVKDLALNPLQQDYVSPTSFTTGAAGGGPTNNAQDIYFGDQNTNEFELTGYIDINRATDESDITGYNVYWGSSENDKLVGQPPIRSFLTSETYLNHYLENVTIPSGATHFLVYSQNENGESISPVFRYIPDTVLKMVADINGSGPSNPHSYKVFNNKLYFSADDGVVGAELWEYDGINAPILTVNIDGGATSSMPVPGKMVVFNAKLYFQACDLTLGCELWRYDGASATQVADINGGSSHSSPEFLTVFNNKLYFKTTNDTSSDGSELWYYDGTPSPVLDTNIGLVYDIWNGVGGSSIKDVTVFNGKIYFGADDNTGSELWWYDGTAPAATIPTNLNIVYNISATDSSADAFTVFNNRLIFSANNDDINGKEIWYYDGAPSPVLGTNIGLLHDIYTGSTGSMPENFTVYNSKLYFSATNAANGKELWVYDGTNTPYLVADIEPGGGSNPSHLIAFNGMLIFSASTVDSGFELYGYTDYDPMGTPFMIADINNGPSSSMPEFMTVFNGRLYFTANDGIKGNELWVYYIKYPY